LVFLKSLFQNNNAYYDCSYSLAEVGSPWRYSTIKLIALSYIKILSLHPMFCYIVIMNILLIKKNFTLFYPSPFSATLSFANPSSMPRLRASPFSVLNTRAMSKDLYFNHDGSTTKKLLV
jgi:hypothetical protein